MSLGRNPLRTLCSQPLLKKRHDQIGLSNWTKAIAKAINDRVIVNDPSENPKSVACNHENPKSLNGVWRNGTFIYKIFADSKS